MLSAHLEFFNLDELRQHIVAASGMKLIQASRFVVPRYALQHPCIMREETHRTPHLIVDFDGIVTTSVILCLQHS